LAAVRRPHSCRQAPDDVLSAPIFPFSPRLRGDFLSPREHLRKSKSQRSNPKHPKIQSRKSKTNHKPRADRALRHLPPPPNWKLNAPLTNSSVASSGSNRKNGNPLTNSARRQSVVSDSVAEKKVQGQRFKVGESQIPNPKSKIQNQKSASPPTAYTKLRPQQVSQTIKSKRLITCNIDAFRKNFTGTEEEQKSNVIYKESDKLSGRQPAQASGREAGLFQTRPELPDSF
jgi:hypothetical protein